MNVVLLPAGSGWQDITLADVLVSLESLHDDKRLSAISACAIAALHKKPASDNVAVVVASKRNVFWSRICCFVTILFAYVRFFFIVASYESGQKAVSTIEG